MNSTFDTATVQHLLNAVEILERDAGWSNKRASEFCAELIVIGKLAERHAREEERRAAIREAARKAEEARGWSEDKEGAYR